LYKKEEKVIKIKRNKNNLKKKKDTGIKTK